MTMLPDSKSRCNMAAGTFHLFQRVELLHAAVYNCLVAANSVLWLIERSLREDKVGCSTVNVALQNTSTELTIAPKLFRSNTGHAKFVLPQGSFGKPLGYEFGLKNPWGMTKFGQGIAKGNKGVYYTGLLEQLFTAALLPRLCHPAGIFR